MFSACSVKRRRNLSSRGMVANACAALAQPIFWAALGRAAATSAQPRKVRVARGTAAFPNAIGNAQDPGVSLGLAAVQAAM